MCCLSAVYKFFKQPQQQQTEAAAAVATTAATQRAASHTFWVQKKTRWKETKLLKGERAGGRRGVQGSRVIGAKASRAMAGGQRRRQLGKAIALESAARKNPKWKMCVKRTKWAHPVASCGMCSSNNRERTQNNNNTLREATATTGANGIPPKQQQKELPQNRQKCSQRFCKRFKCSTQNKPSRQERETRVYQGEWAASELSRLTVGARCSCSCRIALQQVAESAAVYTRTAVIASEDYQLKHKSS